jgi:hypothetical protein
MGSLFIQPSTVRSKRSSYEAIEGAVRPLIWRQDNPFWVPGWTCEYMGPVPGDV